MHDTDSKQHNARKLKRQKKWCPDTCVTQGHAQSITYFFQIVNSSNISLKSSRLWYKTNKAADLTWCKFTYQLMYNTLKHQYLKNWNTVMSSLCAPSSHQWQLYFERFSVLGGHTRGPLPHTSYTHLQHWTHTLHCSFPPGYSAFTHKYSILWPNLLVPLLKL